MASLCVLSRCTVDADADADADRCRRVQVLCGDEVVFQL
jgi:hypothetical protein